jgi:hypothetical protein
MNKADPIPDSMPRVPRRVVAWPSAWGAPRLITRGQVRGYLQMEDAELTQRRKRGQLPGPLWGCDPDLPNARWDRQSIDKALDRTSGVRANDTSEEEQLDRALGTGRYARTRR